MDLTAPGQKRYISAHFRYAFVWATEIRTSDQVREMRSGDPDRRARAIVKAATYFNDPEQLLAASEELGEPMRGLDTAKLDEAELLQTRGW